MPPLWYQNNVDGPDVPIKSVAQSDAPWRQAAKPLGGEPQAACMVFLAGIGGTAMSELIRSDATGFVVGSLMALLYFGTIVLMLLFLS